MVNDESKGINYDYAKDIIYESFKKILLLQSEVDIKSKISKI